MRPAAIVPGWVIFVGATLIAGILSGGLVGLLLEGRPVPAEYWVLLGVIGTAYFGGGPFYQALAHAQTTAGQSRDTIAQTLDTTNHAIAALREIVSGAGISATNGGTATRN